MEVYMNDMSKKITNELVQFQTLAYQCTCLVNHLNREGDTEDKFFEFQNRVFAIVDKINKCELDFSAKDIILINQIKKFIIERYKQESIMTEMIRGDDKMNELFDKKIIEVDALFSQLKSVNNSLILKKMLLRKNFTLKTFL